MQAAPRDCPRGDDLDAARRAHDVFVEHGYTSQGLAEAIHLEGATVVEPKGRAAVFRRTAGGSPRDTLIRLFILGVEVDIAAARAALAPMTPAEWADLGLLRLDGDRATATVQVRCFDDLLVAYDFNRRPWTGAALRADYVMGISLSTLTLAGLTVRRPNRSALDIGTGSGFHAFMAARHSERVVATDRSPRAVQMARFNAALNDLRRVTCVEGDLFEPVRGQRFDLIVSNPPFIISPDSTHYFLHSGLGGDEVCRRIVREAPAMLEEGGMCQLLANWVIPSGGGWRARLESWFDGLDCDGFVLERGHQTPEEYATTWIETAEVEPGAIVPAFDRWSRYFEQNGIEGVGTGLITLRRRTGGPTWFRIARAPEQMVYPAGDEILRVFARGDFLEAVTDDGLLDAPLRLAPGVRLTQESAQEGDHWKVVASHLRRTEGFEYSGGIDGEAVRLLARCDGRTTPRALVADLAVDPGIDRARVATGVASIFRELIERGFVEPAGLRSSGSSEDPTRR